MSGEIASQDCLIHFRIKDLEEARLLPPLVFSTGPDNSHSSYISDKCDLNGLFHETSAGCNFDVHPPGITQIRVVFHSDRLLDGWSYMCPKGILNEKRRFWLFKPQILFNQKLMLLSLFSRSTHKHYHTVRNFIFW